MPRHCSRPRSPASRCSRGRNTPGSAQTTRPLNAQCPGRPAGSTRIRSRRAARDRASTAGSSARVSADRRCCRSARRNPDPGDATSLSGWSCTGTEAGSLPRLREFPRSSNRHFELACFYTSFVAGVFYHRVVEVLYDGRFDGLTHKIVDRQCPFRRVDVAAPCFGRGMLGREQLAAVLILDDRDRKCARAAAPPP